MAVTSSRITTNSGTRARKRPSPRQKHPTASDSRVLCWFVVSFRVPSGMSCESVMSASGTEAELGQQGRRIRVFVPRASFLSDPEGSEIPLARFRSPSDGPCWSVGQAKPTRPRLDAKSKCRRRSPCGAGMRSVVVSERGTTPCGCNSRTTRGQNLGTLRQSSKTVGRRDCYTEAGATAT